MPVNTMQHYIQLILNSLLFVKVVACVCHTFILVPLLYHFYALLNSVPGSKFGCGNILFALNLQKQYKMDLRVLASTLLLIMALTDAKPNKSGKQPACS